MNKGGGAGMPGFEYVLKSKPDGYTISAPGVGACISSAMFLRNKTYNFDDMTLVGGYMLLAGKDHGHAQGHGHSV